MADGSNNEPAAPARTRAAVVLQCNERIDGALQEYVVPAAKKDGRSMHALGLRLWI
jgi:hypothetical protein